MPQVTRPDGVRIHYEIAGRRDRTPVLMIQGLGADSRGWALQRLAFGRKHRTLLPDNRGVGLSDRPPGPYSLFDMADDAIACLDQEGIERAHVMGASMGGILAQIIAVTYPERVRSLVLACTACRHHTWRKELLAEWADAVRDRGMAAISDDGLQWLVGPRLQRRFGVLINVLARVVLQSPPEPFIAQIDAILSMSDDLRDELHTIAVPTLVITGSQDSLTPMGDAEELAEMIPGARLILLSGAAHGLMAEAPNAFNTAVLDFLDRVDASSATAGSAASA
jgi:3-oxoadipate enol-lactonase